MSRSRSYLGAPSAASVSARRAMSARKRLLRAENPLRSARRRCRAEHGRAATHSPRSRGSHPRAHSHAGIALIAYGERRASRVSVRMSGAAAVIANSRAACSSVNKPLIRRAFCPVHARATTRPVANLNGQPVAAACVCNRGGSRHDAQRPDEGDQDGQRSDLELRRSDADAPVRRAERRAGEKGRGWLPDRGAEDRHHAGNSGQHRRSPAPRTWARR